MTTGKSVNPKGLRPKSEREDAMHPNLSPALNALAEASRNKEGLEIANIPKGAMIDVKTLNSVYTLVAVDPAKSEFAVTSTKKEYAEPDLYTVPGSVVGGAIRLGWIGVGFRLRFMRLAGGAFNTSAVERYDVRDEPEEAARIVSEAEAKRPPVPTEDEIRDYKERFDAAVAEILGEEFPPGDIRTRAEASVKRFGNIPGRTAALGFLSQALKHGVSPDRAFQLLDGAWEEYWQWQDPEAAGDPELFPATASQWDELYAELDVPKPGDDKD